MFMQSKRKKTNIAKVKLKNTKNIELNAVNMSAFYEL